jgi:hypothetical protein
MQLSSETISKLTGSEEDERIFVGADRERIHKKTSWVRSTPNRLAVHACMPFDPALK